MEAPLDAIRRSRGGGRGRRACVTVPGESVRAVMLSGLVRGSEGCPPFVHSSRRASSFLNHRRRGETEILSARCLPDGFRLGYELAAPATFSYIGASGLAAWEIEHR